MNRMVERVKQEVRVQQALETGNGLLSSALQYKIASAFQLGTSGNPPKATDHLTDSSYWRLLQRNAQSAADDQEAYAGSRGNAQDIVRSIREAAPGYRRNLPENLPDPTDENDVATYEAIRHAGQKEIARGIMRTDGGQGIPALEELRIADADRRDAAANDNLTDSSYWRLLRNAQSAAADQEAYAGSLRNAQDIVRSSRKAAPKPAPPAPIKPGTDKLLARIEKLMGKVPGGATTVGAAGGATVGGGAGALIGGAFDRKGSRRKAIVGMLAGMLAGGAAGGYAGHKYQA